MQIKHWDIDLHHRDWHTSKRIRITTAYVDIGRKEISITVMRMFIGLDFLECNIDILKYVRFELPFDKTISFGIYTETPKQNGEKSFAPLVSLKH